MTDAAPMPDMRLTSIEMKNPADHARMRTTPTWRTIGGNGELRLGDLSRSAVPKVVTNAITKMERLPAIHVSRPIPNRPYSEKWGLVHRQKMLSFPTSMENVGRAGFIPQPMSITITMQSVDTHNKSVALSVFVE